MQGRCPSCNQLLTLSDAARSQFVQCPKCTHQAIGAVFIDLETPQPVVMLPLDVQLGQAVSQPPMLEARGSWMPTVARVAAPLEERTHILLEPVSADDAKEHTVELRVPSILGARAAPNDAADEARTHLLLDAADVKEERAVLAPVRDRLHPVAQAVLGFGARLSDGLHGRWPLVLLGLAVVCGVVAPLFDFLTDSLVLSGVLSVVFVLLLGVFALAWAGRLGPSAGSSFTRAAGARLKARLRLSSEDLEELGRSPRHLKLLVVGELLGAAGLLGLSAASLRSVGRLLLGRDDIPTALRWASGVALIVGIILMQRAQKLAPVSAPGPEDLNESVTAASKLPAIVDLSDPLPPSFIGEYTPLHRILMVLSEWRSPAWPDVVGYQAALERHFQRHLTGSRVERDRWLGRSRRDGVADLVVDDLVLIMVRHGFHAPAADRAVAELDALARRWQGRPLLLLIFDAPRDDVFEGPGTPALRELHARLPMLTARMPTLERR
jgi:hypothetical protein